MATWNKQISLLIDMSHNNLVQPDEPDFKLFFELLESKGYNIHLTKSNQKLFEQDFENMRTFLIGVPQNCFLFQEEINSILNFVRNGGSLLIFHRYGGDLLQKSNLNDLTSHFGIYFENTVIKDTNNVGLETIPIVSTFSANSIMNGIHKLTFPGSCTLRLAKEAQPLCLTNNSSMIDIFNPHTFDWLKHEISESLPIASYAVYGQGRVITIGTPDFLCSEELFGLSSLDNRRFCLSLFQWLMNPVSDLEIRDWMLQQLGNFSEDIVQIKIFAQSIQNTLESFDRRVRDLEYKYYALEGVHIPQASDDLAEIEDDSADTTIKLTSIPNFEAEELDSTKFKNDDDE